MAERRMTCWQCPRYDRAERRCRDGKANPKSKADSVLVAETLGARALCHYNPYRDGIALRMIYPKTPAARETVRSRRSPLRPAKIEIEIETPETESDSPQ